MSAPLKRPTVKETDVSRQIRTALQLHKLGIYVDTGQARTDEAKAALIRNAIVIAKERGRPVWIYWRQNTGAGQLATARGPGRFVRFALPGSADYTGIVYPQGRRLDLEIKRPGGKPSPMQLALCDVVNGAGGRYVVVDSVSRAIDVVADILKHTGIPWALGAT